jgi:hypothetical protein
MAIQLKKTASVRKYFRERARQMGRVKSEAKSNACVKNGKLGVQARKKKRELEKKAQVSLGTNDIQD